MEALRQFCLAQLKPTTAQSAQLSQPGCVQTLSCVFRGICNIDLVEWKASPPHTVTHFAFTIFCGQLTTATLLTAMYNMVT